MKETRQLKRKAECRGRGNVKHAPEERGEKRKQVLRLRVEMQHYRGSREWPCDLTLDGAITEKIVGIECEDLCTRQRVPPEVGFLTAPTPPD